jgi:hypothetical protein
MRYKLALFRRNAYLHRQRMERAEKVRRSIGSVSARPEKRPGPPIELNA